MHIPGYKALRVVLGKDPITDDHVERNGRNFIEAAFDIMPGGELLHKKLDEQHQLDAAALWIDGKIGEIETIVNGLFSRMTAFWDDLGITDLRSPMTVLRNGANIVLDFIGDVIDFAIKAGTELLEMVKKFLLDKIVEFIKEKTTAYPLLCVILGEDPITKQQVDRNGTNILNALLDLGGEEGQMQRDQMNDTGTFQKIAAYIDEGIAVFGRLYDTIVNGFSLIWDMVTIDALMDPVGTFEKIYEIFGGPVMDVLDWVGRVIMEILRLIKDVLFKRISEEAKKTRGYYLVTVLIGRDPFTQENVPRSMENIIHGFMSLMDGGEEQFQQMKESGAIDKTTARINAAVKQLNMTPQAIVQLFIDLWESFTFRDFLHPIATFQRIVAKFGEPIGRLIAFVVEIVKIVVEVILRIMNFPFDLINKIIANAMKAFHLIKQDPIGFLKNLLRAIKEGFIQFFDNIAQHLLQGLVGWLTSELKDAGVPELKDLSLKGVIAWVLEVLGISMEKVWEKLAAHPRIGPAKVAKIRSAINTLEGIWTFIKDVQERGMAAIWDKIAEQLNNLWDTIIGAVKNWIMEKIIGAVVTKLLSMLDPTGIMAVINSAIAIYKAVQSFIKYLRQMLEIVNSFVEGVAEIAMGNTKKAADFLERSLARGVPILIGFLANQVGLGGVGEKIGEMIEVARGYVDQAIGWLVNKAVDTAFGVIDRLMGRGGPEGEPAPEPVPNDPEAHRQLAMQAKGELENTPVTATNPTEALAQKNAAARTIENNYSARLQAPLRMTITLTEQSHTEAAEQIATRIVIAPNDTVVEETIVVNLAGGPTTLAVGTALRRKETNGWTHGVISAIGAHDTAGMSATIQFGRDARGGTTTIIPVHTLQANLAMSPDAVPVGSYAMGGEAPDHKLYEPKDLKTIASNDTVTRLTYKTQTDAEFTVNINHEMQTHTITGTGLQLKDLAGVEGRGVTETPAGFITGVNLNRAHLIADRFTGSGFVEGENLISTSAQYNQRDMKGAEDSIVRALLAFSAETFDLTVRAQLGSLSTATVRDAIAASVPEAERAAVEASVAAFASAHSNFTVCLRVTYNGRMKKAPNLTNNISAGPLGPDRYLRL
jgi:ABC-type multidrug transport system fused ATPase/permease subunit